MMHDRASGICYAAPATASGASAPLRTARATPSTSASSTIVVSWSHSTRNASWPLIEWISRYWRLGARRHRGVHERADLVGPVEDVAGDADARDARAGGRERPVRLDDPAAIPADVVAVHDPDEDRVRLGVEPVEQLVALVVEVGRDREPAVGFAAPPEPVVEVRLRAVGRHRELAGELEAPVAERVDGSSWMWFHAIAIGPVAAGAAIGSRWSTASGRSSATSWAIIPPREPPVTSTKRSMPSRSASAHSARASSRAVGWGSSHPTAGRSTGPRRRAGGAVAPAEEVRAQSNTRSKR